jgi:hypothetical protein
MLPVKIVLLWAFSETASVVGQEEHVPEGYGLAT